MTTLLEQIEAFNRKERFFLFTYATGNPRFVLSAEFRAALGGAVGVEIPADAQAYIDYHLDWLHAAVELARNPDAGTVRSNQSDDSGGSTSTYTVSTGNQEDIDLVVAFERESATWLILVEAKAETGWTNKQVRSKADRLAAIFGDGPISAEAMIRPVFCLMSPRPPSRLVPVEGSAWPTWMLRTKAEGGISAGPFNWLNLPVPPTRMKVTGCLSDGAPSNLRPFWKAERVGKVEAVVE